MKPLALAALVTIVGLPVSTLAQSEDSPPVTVEVTEFDEAGVYRRRLRITSHRAQRVLVDRRALRFTVRPEGSRRRHTCRHPDASRVGHTQMMASGESVEEWFDLRMYCTGPALTALQSGSATLEARYEGRRRTPVARAEGERRSLRRVILEPFQWTQSTQEPEDSPVELYLRPHTTRGMPLFRPVLRASGRVYIRDDMFGFHVVGPNGSFKCSREHQTIVPIRDFFRRSGRRHSDTLASDYFCPDDAFEDEGAYVVTPSIRLVYDGAQYGLRAIVGEFEGRPAIIRVRRGRRGYQIQDPEALLRRMREEGES